MSLAGTLLILVAMFTNKWLEGQYAPSNVNSLEGIKNTVGNIFTGIENAVNDGTPEELLQNDVGLFLHCTVPSGQKFFEGECIPDWGTLEKMFTELNEKKYPHAWRGAVLCFVFGLLLMVVTDLFALLTICCRRCVCCSVFTVCGSLQSFAAILFTLGLVAYPAGWGSQIVSEGYCGGKSKMFMLGDVCELGFAFWLAVAGTVCTMLASSLAIWAYQSTRTDKCEERIDQGEKYICLP